MFNPFSLIKNIYDASEAGQQLANAETWSKVASVTGVLSTLIGIGLALLAQFTSIDLGLTDEQVHTVAVGIATFGCAIADRLHVATNPNAGRAASVQGDQ